MNALVKRLRRVAADDRGITLIEIVVTVSILSVVMVLFTGGMLQMYSSTNKSEAVSGAQSQLRLALLRLDKEVRYAAGIHKEHMIGSDQYIEYLITDASSGTPVSRCAQLRLNRADKTLERTTWSPGNRPAAGDLVWSRIAFGVDVPSSSFTLDDTDGDDEFQRLRLRLVLESGAGATRSTTTSDITFTALNSSRKTKSADVCPEGSP